MTPTEREAQTRALEQMRYQAELRAKARRISRRQVIDVPTILTALVLGIIAMVAYACVMEGLR